MPLFWDSIDTRNAILCATVPSLPALVGSALAIKDDSLMLFMKRQQFPTCAVRCKPFYLVTNTGTAVPFGYASYLIYKIGGGFDYTDTTVALGLYGATVASGIALIPVLNKKSTKALSVTTAIVAGLAVATTASFYTIDKISAYWTLPFTLWALYCAGMAFKAHAGKEGIESIQ